jgi:hypothetical protein
VAGGGRLDRLQRLQVDRGGDVAGDAEVVAEVAGADEQHVDAVDGGDGVGLGHGRVHVGDRGHRHRAHPSRKRVRACSLSPEAHASRPTVPW